MTSRKAIACMAPKTLSFSSSTLAHMVKIDWTTAPVVKITARKALKLVCQQVAVVRGHYMAQRNLFIEVLADTTLHFVASERGDGWYYIVCMGKCSCPAHHFQKSCKHLVLVEAFASKATKAAHMVSKEELQKAQAAFWQAESKVSHARTDEARATWTTKRETARAEHQCLLAAYAAAQAA